MNGHGRARPRRLPWASITTTTRVDMSAFGVRPPTPADVVEDASHLSTMVCVQNLSRGSWEEDVHPSPYHMPVASAQGNPTRDSPKPSEARNDLAHTPAVTGHSGFPVKREPQFRGSVSKAVDMNSSGFRVHRRRTFSDTPAPLWSCDSQFLAAFFSLLYRLVDIFFSNASWRLSAMRLFCRCVALASRWDAPPTGPYAATFLQLRGPHGAALLLWHCTSSSFYPRGHGGLGTFLETQRPIPHERVKRPTQGPSMLHASCQRQCGGGGRFGFSPPKAKRREMHINTTGKRRPTPARMAVIAQTSVGKDVLKGDPRAWLADWKTVCRCLRKLKTTARQSHF